MPKLTDLTDQTFGRLTVIRYADRGSDGKARWFCRCECGTEKIIRQECLKRGTTKSCGCHRAREAANRILDLTGKTFGFLQVIKRVDNIGKKPAWQCRCVCGNITISFGDQLRYGHVKSCGCKTGQIIRDALCKPNRNTRAYSIWTSIKTRCRNPRCRSYANYGGRGIDICNKWADNFDAFFADVGEPPTAKHQIDRIDNEKGYEPGNVRYVLPIVNINNTRKNRRITFNGDTRTVSEWARHYGMQPGTLRARLETYGWSAEKALTTPVRRRRNTVSR